MMRKMLITRVNLLSLGTLCESLAHPHDQDHLVTLHVMVESDIIGYQFSVVGIKIIDPRALKYEIRLRFADDTPDLPKDRDLVATISFLGSTDGLLEIPVEDPHTEGN